MLQLINTLLPSIWLITIPLLIILLINKLISSTPTASKPENATISFPKAYPIIGHLFAIYQHRTHVLQYLSILVSNSPTSTFVVRRPGRVSILTGNPSNVEHVLKTKFPIYQKGPMIRSIFEDLFGNSMFTVNGEQLKFQKQVVIQDFHTKSLRKFVENVVDVEITGRLLPVLSHASDNQKVVDLQDIFQRFAFDNVCKLAFGHDPECLSPSLSPVKFSIAFDQAVLNSTKRIKSLLPILWKIRRFLNVGSERLLKESNRVVREFTNSVIKQKKELLLKNENDPKQRESKDYDDDGDDMLARLVKLIPSDEKLISDIMVSTIIAGRDTTSAALTWFFWLLHKNKSVEDEIVSEIKRTRRDKNNSNGTNDCNEFSYEQTKEMIYTHAALSESMRLYPPVPSDGKQAICDDVLPDGTQVKKGWVVAYMPYAMGRIEKLWGQDWAEYKPERWLVRQDSGECKWKFVPRDPFSYPVFQAGPRICLGKEMAFLQMKRVVAAILERFTVVPAWDQGTEPVYVSFLTAKMQGGFPVRIQERIVSQV